MKTMGSLCVLLVGLIAIGCESKPEKKDAKVVAMSDEKKPEAESKHGEWWCNEHGVKEEECSMCNAKVAKAFQAKGDWCKEHSRAKSQCFICEPKLQAKFAADYVAKFGKQPPEPEGQEPDKK